MTIFLLLLTTYENLDILLDHLCCVISNFLLLLDSDTSSRKVTTIQDKKVGEPIYKISDWSKIKALADDKIDVTQKLKYKTLREKEKMLSYLKMFSEASSFKVIMPPFNEIGVYCFAHVGRSIGLSVGIPNLVRMIARHRIDLSLSNLAQTCVLGV